MVASLRILPFVSAALGAGCRVKRQTGLNLPAWQVVLGDSVCRPVERSPRLAGLFYCRSQIRIATGKKTLRPRRGAGQRLTTFCSATSRRIPTSGDNSSQRGTNSGTYPRIPKTVCHCLLTHTNPRRLTHGSPTAHLAVRRMFGPAGARRALDKHST